MDNLTHSLLGAALAKTPLGRASPLAPAALVIAANLPDFEVLVLTFCDKPTNMMHHRGITHSVLGILILAPLLTLLWRGVERRWARAGPRGSFLGLLTGVFLAAASHPLLDWLNTYGVRPWLPFDTTRYHGDLTFIVDPWLWLLLGAVVCLAGERTRAGSVLLAIVAIPATAFVVLTSAVTPAALHVVWPVAIGALLIARWSGLGRKHALAFVAVGLTLAVGYVGFLGWSGRRAWRQSERVISAQLPAGETIIAHTISPQLADPLHWGIVAETEQAVYRHEFSIRSGPGGAVRLAKRLEDPLVCTLEGTPEYRAWRYFARHPVAAVARNGYGRRLYLLDARYGVFPARGFSGFAIDIPASP